MKYFITYLNLENGFRKYYMGKMLFTKLEAKIEIVLLKKQQKERETLHHLKKNRGKFQLKKVK